MAEAGAGSGRVKICGLCRREDVLVADAAGADYLGAVVTVGFGRTVDLERVPGLMAGVEAVPVAVLVDEEPADAVRLARTLGAGVVQLHGEETPATVAAVSGAGPWAVWKAVRVREPGELDRAVEAFGEVAHGLLVEGWREGVVGGGGVRLGDALAERAGGAIPEGLDFILAGGLTADSVFDAVARFAPDVVDVSSGVEETLCRKDPLKVRRFVEEARRAWSRAGPPPTPNDPGASA